MAALANIDVWLHPPAAGTPFGYIFMKRTELPEILCESDTTRNYYHNLYKVSLQLSVLDGCHSCVSECFRVVLCNVSSRFDLPKRLTTTSWYDWSEQAIWRMKKGRSLEDDQDLVRNHHRSSSNQGWHKVPQRKLKHSTLCLKGYDNIVVLRCIPCWQLIKASTKLSPSVFLSLGIQWYAWSPPNRSYLDTLPRITEAVVVWWFFPIPGLATPKPWFIVFIGSPML